MVWKFKTLTCTSVEKHSTLNIKALFKGKQLSSLFISCLGKQLMKKPNASGGKIGGFFYCKKPHNDGKALRA